MPDPRDLALEVLPCTCFLYFSNKLTKILVLKMLSAPTMNGKDSATQESQTLTTLANQRQSVKFVRKLEFVFDCCLNFPEKEFSVSLAAGERAERESELSNSKSSADGAAPDCP